MTAEEKLNEIRAILAEVLVTFERAALNEQPASIELVLTALATISWIVRIERPDHLH